MKEVVNFSKEATASKSTLTLRMVMRMIFVFIIIFSLTGCASNRTIVHGLEEREANDILVFLDNKGISATKVQVQEAAGTGGKLVLWNIEVQETEATQAMALLNAAGLPRRPTHSLLTIFAKGGLVPSELEEKIRYQSGLGEQIGSIIRKIDGVLEADVQLSFPEKDPLNPLAQKGKETASVYIKHTGVLDDPNSQLIPKIKRLVAGSVQGLDYENVTVIPDRARFSEIPLHQQIGKRGFEEQDYVSIWSVVLAKESAFRFRLFFFSFTIAIFILTLLLVWVIWKFLPIIDKAGGVKQLLSFHQIGSETAKPEPEKIEEEEAEENEEIPKE